MIEAIRSSLSQQGFDPAHALIVRPLGDTFQILSGHHRSEAAKRAGLGEVPCWVRDLDDDAAYMLLATSNAQGELSPLERGMHALNSGMDVKGYAASVGRARTSVQHEVYAAAVATAVPHVGHGEITDKTRHLDEIHAAPSWLWPALVAAMLAKGWNVETTRAQVARLKDVTADPPGWLADGVPAALVDGAMRATDISRMVELVEKTRAELAAEDDCPPLDLSDAVFGSYSDAMAFCDRVLAEVRRRRQAARQAQQRGKEAAEAKASQLLEYVSLDEWKQLDDATKAALLPPDPALVSVGQFNRQENAAIEWAMWSWNPITGCLHDCPYCYARDIATSAKAAKVYPNGFAPTLRPRSLLVPRTMQVPLDAARDARYRNVFTGSMADIFGRWVPVEWIEALLSEIRSAHDWNFLCLTKFPKRMAEFDIPSNAWMGTTVDLQARVAAAEAGFASVGAKVKWLSIEPMIEPLHFQHLDRFDWIVIGGASRQSGTPEWKPPFAWIIDLVNQARDAGVKVYFKTNLLGARILELPFGAPIEADPVTAPAVFHYLKPERNAA